MKQDDDKNSDQDESNPNDSSLQDNDDDDYDQDSSEQDGEEEKEEEPAEIPMLRFAVGMGAQKTEMSMLKEKLSNLDAKSRFHQFFSNEERVQVINGLIQVTRDPTVFYILLSYIQ